MNMSDRVSIKRITTCHPQVRHDLSLILIECERAGVGIRYTQALRTFEYQNDLYQKYLKGGPKAAPPGLSYHEYGLAVDICLYHKDGSISYDMTEDMDKDKIKDFEEVAKIFELYGWRWGKAFKDPDHFEKSFGYSVQGLKHLKSIGKVDKQGYVIL